jgi:hypothetical protein
MQRAQGPQKGKQKLDEEEDNGEDEFSESE